jgi:hypothetical protein
VESEGKSSIGFLLRKKAFIFHPITSPDEQICVVYPNKNNLVVLSHCLFFF